MRTKDQVVYLLRSLSRSRSRSTTSRSTPSTFRYHKSHYEYMAAREEKEEELGNSFRDETSNNKQVIDDDMLELELGRQPSSSSSSSSSSTSTCLTVWTKSLLLSCSGFTVIDPKGDLAYRVDNYTGRPVEVVLMDGYGHSILTIRRHKNLIADDWLICKGEPTNNARSSKMKHHHQQLQIIKALPLYRVKKQTKKNIRQQQPTSSENGINKVLAHVYQVETGGGPKKTRSPAYVIEGSYCHRSCTVLDYTGSGSRSSSPPVVVAEVRRKEAINCCASFGLEVFHLIICPGFDSAFAMALVLLLDQMFT